MAAKIFQEKLHFHPPSYHLIACFEVCALLGEICFLSNEVISKKESPVTLPIKPTIDPFPRPSFFVTYVSIFDLGNNWYSGLIAIANDAWELYNHLPS